MGLRTRSPAQAWAPGYDLGMRPDTQELQPPPEEPFPDLQVGKSRLRDFTLKRVRASLPLQVCMCVAFVCYGALVFLAISQKLQVATAAVVVLMSLASWYFIFWWFPVLERTQAHLAQDPSKAWIPRALEVFATLCVAVVHVLILVIVVMQAGEPT